MLYEHDELTEAIIGCAYTVLNTLGHGFLEKVYENALAHELRKQGFSAQQQCPLHVLYDGILVGEYYADILVGSRVIVELKAIKGLDDSHVTQCINYLRATRLKTCLLLNFGVPKLGIKRVSL
jgi:GxxExxY protein